MNRDIFVVEVIADGPNGFPKDEIVQIGIAAVDLSSMEAESVYLATISTDPDNIGESKRAYIGSKVSSDDLVSGRPIDEVSKDVKSLLAGKDVTSFEVSNTFGRYLIYNPWDLTHEVTVLPSVGARFPGNIRGVNPSNENAYIDNAYSSMYPDDRYCMKDGRSALDYALRTSYVLIGMREKGIY